LLGGDTIRSTEGARYRRAGVVLALLSALFGLFVMATFIFDLMWPWWPSTATMPAFTVGVNLLALGVAVPLSVSRVRSRVLAGQIATLLVFSLTAVIFVGYSFGEASIGRLFVQPEISFQAAFGLLLIGLGIVFIRPGSGLLPLASSPTQGGTMIRWLGPVVLLAPAGLLLLVEALPNDTRVDGLAVVAVSLGFLLLLLLGFLARALDVSELTATTALAQARRAEIGLEQQAPLASHLANILHVVDAPDREGWEVATRYRPGQGVVAGDASAVIRIADGGLLGAVLVDAPGHGADPAIQAIRVRDQLAYALSLGQDPADALSFLSHVTREAELTSAIVGRVNLSTGEVVIASAGHPPAIHISSQESELINPSGPLLFLDPDARYGDYEFTLKRGESLVFFSDGVADVQAEDGGLTEPEQIADLLLAEGGLASRTADLVLGFAEGRPQDDQTVVVVVRA
jgi:hypothetical protein